MMARTLDMLKRYTWPGNLRELRNKKIGITGLGAMFEAGSGSATRAAAVGEVILGVALALTGQVTSLAQYYLCFGVLGAVAFRPDQLELELA